MDANGVLLPRGRGTLVVRTAGADPLAMAGGVAVGGSSDAASFHVDSIRTQVEINGARMLRERMLAMLATFFAMVALALAGVGLYGVLDYSVLQRRREIGIRMAIGARGGDIARNVAAGIFAVVGAGAIAGVAFGLGAARYVESMLFGVKATDPRMMAVPALSLLVVAAVAALRPIIRAVRVDPAGVLRSE